MKNILIIEDDLNISYIYKTALNKAGILDVEILNSGEDALRSIKEMQAGKKQNPVLILLDLGLPDINTGLEILSLIKNNSITKNIATFILSNYTEDLKELFSSLKGVAPDKFFLKTSIMPVELVDLVKEQFNKISLWKITGIQNQ